MKCVVAFYINSVENNMKNDYVTKNDTTTTTATKKNDVWYSNTLVKPKKCHWQVQSETLNGN